MDAEHDLGRRRGSVLVRHAREGVGAKSAGGRGRAPAVRGEFVRLAGEAASGAASRRISCDARALELARERVPLNISQCQLGLQASHHFDRPPRDRSRGDDHGHSHAHPLMMSAGARARSEPRRAGRRRAPAPPWRTERCCGAGQYSWDSSRWTASGAVRREPQTAPSVREQRSQPALPLLVQARCERAIRRVLCAVCRWQDDPAFDRWCCRHQTRSDSCQRRSYGDARPGIHSMRPPGTKRTASEPGGRR
jgi:hypothetical protein